VEQIMSEETERAAELPELPEPAGEIWSAGFDGLVQVEDTYSATQMHAYARA